jgi:hypothetical protein
MLASPDAACLNPSALLSLATGQSSGNNSIVDPVNNWLKGLCPLPPCTNSSLAAVVTNLTSGCRTELSSFGLSTDDASQAVTVVQEIYPTVRQVACLQDTSANQLCVTELLTNIQSSVGTLSITNIVQIIPNIASGSVTIPKNVTCSDCVKQAYNIVNKDFPGSIPPQAASGLSSACGSSFTDGATPSEISESASTASAGSASTKSGAMSLFSVNSVIAAAVSTLVVVSSAFAVLA